MDRKQKGMLGERLALEYFKKRNCRIFAQNYRAGRLGEIDLVVSDRDCLTFVEVKTRTGNTFGTPAEAVSYKKQKTIRQVAACYLKANGFFDISVRFDVVEVIITQQGELVHIRHLQNVF